ncbi:MAG: glutathione peroxidase [Oscillospiraceae bacterium]|nr:glutathione peroxidase [Oscillospiraceae bacterium]
MSIYDFTVKGQDGSDISLSEYKGKVLLIVNTATACGFTPQYEELQELYDEFKDKGLEILDFPCNQFGNQAPGSDEEIQSFCTTKYSTTFPRFSKVDVVGETAIPLFKWLEENTKFEGFDKNPMGLMMSQLMKKMDKNYKDSSSVKWNFTKFLISRDGEILARFEPTNAMKKVKAKIAEVM